MFIYKFQKLSPSALKPIGLLSSSHGKERSALKKKGKFKYNKQEFNYSIKLNNATLLLQSLAVIRLSLDYAQQDKK